MNSHECNEMNEMNDSTVEDAAVFTAETDGERLDSFIAREG